MPFFPPTMEPPQQDLPSETTPEQADQAGETQPDPPPFLAICPARPSDDPSSNMMSLRIRVKNRRRVYLRLNPSYFTDPNLELANPLLYDRLVRRLQSNAEREADGRKRGFARILEADLCRAEAKVASLSETESQSRPERHQQGTVEDLYEAPETKEEGARRWKEAMEMRFVAGDDEDFDYSKVDNNEAYDDRIEEDRETLDTYLEGEEPQFVLDEGKSLQGETGIQDY